MVNHINPVSNIDIDSILERFKTVDRDVDVAKIRRILTGKNKDIINNDEDLKKLIYDDPLDVEYVVDGETLIKYGVPLVNECRLLTYVTFDDVVTGVKNNFDVDITYDDIDSAWDDGMIKDIDIASLISNMRDNGVEFAEDLEIGGLDKVAYGDMFIDAVENAIHGGEQKTYREFINDVENEICDDDSEY